MGKTVEYIFNIQREYVYLWIESSFFSGTKKIFSLSGSVFEFRLSGNDFTFRLSGY